MRFVKWLYILWVLVRPARVSQVNQAVEFKDTLPSDHLDARRDPTLQSDLARYLRAPSVEGGGVASSKDAP